jgi:uncharacterized membrane protein SirB2
MFLFFHIGGLILWVVSLAVQLTWFFVPNRSSVQRKIWFGGVLPGTVLFALGGIGLLFEEGYHLSEESWLWAKIFFLLLIIVADVAIQKRLLADRTSLGGGKNMAERFVRWTALLVLLGVVGGLVTVAWHEEQEERERQMRRNLPQAETVAE